MATRKKSMYLEIEPHTEIYLEEAGSGAPLLLLPGITYSCEIFAAQLEYFSKSHRVIAMDPRSHGRSTKTAFGNNYLTHGRDVEAVIRALGLKDVVLLGWSAGCIDIWTYVRQFGTSNLKGAALIDMPPKPISDNPADWVEGSATDLAAALTEVLTSQKSQREFFGSYAADLMVQRELGDEEKFFLVDLSARTPCNITAALYGDLIMQDCRPDFTRLSEAVPSKTYVAEHWSGVAVPYLKKRFPKTQVEVFGGHLLFWEYPERFNASLEQFLAAL
ncbi:MAG: alpha/beta hydrolase [Deltaproteobacteria bacterium]|jgi:pimeloyl-ACP methyl ester carboxylesterase|nr:alpha/beta hydrolase [Deltaproteobacteria bacterium]